MQPGYRGRRARPTTRRSSRSCTSRRTSSSITPSVELASDRWSDVTGGGYVRTGDYTLLNLQVQYRGSDLWEIAVGGTNLPDENFELAHGYPEPGRNVYVRLALELLSARRPLHHGVYGHRLHERKHSCIAVKGEAARCVFHDVRQ